MLAPQRNDDAISGRVEISVSAQVLKRCAGKPNLVEYVRLLGGGAHSAQFRDEFSHWAGALLASADWEVVRLMTNIATRVR
jgi:hypothetical protein